MTLHSVNIISFRCFTPVRCPSYRWQYGSIFIEISILGSKRCIYSAIKCVSTIQGSRSSKVNDFGTNRKRVWYFLLVRHSNHGPIISDMLQLFGWKLQIFPILLSCGAPLRMFYMVLRAFVVKFTTKKLVMGLFSSEDRMIVVWVILIQHQRVTDRRTYGRTDLL